MKDEYLEILRNAVEACRKFVKFSELPETVTRSQHIKYQVDCLAKARDVVDRYKKLLEEQAE